MRLLLIQLAQRLAGQGGEPVIQLQTAFGGGKTHTMLAVYHLATRKCALSELTGIPSVLDQAGIKDVPRAHVTVLDGSAHAPGQSWKRGKQAIKTLWGELALWSAAIFLLIHVPSGCDIGAQRKRRLVHSAHQSVSPAPSPALDCPD
jgi:uncharacterized protein